MKLIKKEIYDPWTIYKCFTLKYICISVVTRNAWGLWKFDMNKGKWNLSVMEMLFINWKKKLYNLTKNWKTEPRVTQSPIYKYVQGHLTGTKSSSMKTSI